MPDFTKNTTPSSTSSKKKSSNPIGSLLGDAISSDLNPIKQIGSHLPSVVRTPIRLGFQALQLPTNAFLSAGKELTDYGRGNGAPSLKDFVNQTVHGIGFAHATGLDSPNLPGPSWVGPTLGLAGDLFLAARTNPGLGTVEAGATGFTKALRGQTQALAREGAARAIVPTLEDLGVTGAKGAEVGKDAAVAAGHAVNPQALQDVAQLVTKGRGTLTREQLLSTFSRERRVTLGSVAIPGTEGLATALDQGLGKVLGPTKGALVKAFTRQGIDPETGKIIAASAAQKLDAFSPTGMLLRNGAVVAQTTGNTEPLLNALNLTHSRAFGIGYGSARAEKNAEQFMADAKTITGEDTVAKAVQMVRDRPDKGAESAMRWAQGDINPADPIHAMLSSAKNLIQTDGAVHFASNPQAFGALQEGLAKRIATFADDVKASQTQIGGSRFNLWRTGTKDVISSVVAPWIADASKVIAGEDIAKAPELVARMMMASPAQADLPNMEQMLQHAADQRDAYRSSLFQSRTLSTLLPGEKRGITAEARFAKAAEDAKLSGVQNYQDALSTVEKATSLFPEASALYDPIHTKYTTLADQWTNTKALQDRLSTLTSTGARDLAAASEGPRAANFAMRAQEAATSRLGQLADQRSLLARRMNLAKGQLTAVESRLSDLAASAQVGLPTVSEEATQALKGQIEADLRTNVSALEMDAELARAQTKRVQGAYKTSVAQTADEAGISALKGVTPAQRLSLILNKAGDADQAFMKASAASMWDNVVRLGKYGLVDQDTFNRVMGLVGGSDAVAGFTKHFQGVTNLFRTSAIASPMFSNRNFVGAVMNNFAHGITLAETRAAVKQIVSGEGPNLAGFVQRQGDISKSLSRDIEVNQFASAPQRAMQTVQQTLDKTGISARGILTGTVRDEAKVESVVRLAAFNHAIDKLGMTPDAAWAYVQHIHFDYTDLSHADIAAKRLVPFWCVPDDHQILTEFGWRTVDEITVGEKVLTFDHDTHEIRWEPLLDVQTFQYEGELVAWNGFEFTENHRWPYVTTKTFVKGKWYGGQHGLAPWNELRNSDSIPKTGDFRGSGSILSPRLAAILGWIVTDGYMRCRFPDRGTGWEALVYQSPKKHLDEIIGLLGTRPRNPHPTTGVVAVPVSWDDLHAILDVGFKSKDDLPSIVSQLSRESAEAMWNAMVKAEAHDAGPKGLQFTQKAGGVLDGFQMLCLLTGRNGKITGPREKGVYTIYVTKTQAAYRHKRDGRVQFSGRIWCPVTPSGTWFVRHDGAVLPTGNTWTSRNLPAQAELLVRNQGIGRQLEIAMATSRDQQQGSAFPPFLAGSSFALGGNRTLDFSGMPSVDLTKLIDNPGGIGGAARDFLGGLTPGIKIPLDFAYNSEQGSGRAFSPVRAAAGVVPSLSTAARVASFMTPDLLRQLHLGALKPKSQLQGIRALPGILGSPIDVRQWGG